MKGILVPKEMAELRGKQGLFYWRVQPEVAKSKKRLQNDEYATPQTVVSIGPPHDATESVCKCNSDEKVSEDPPR